MMQVMSTAPCCPIDLELTLSDNLSDSYEFSKVLLAKAGADGTLQLLTSGWERVLGYAREELKRKTLLDLVWRNRHRAATAAAAILDTADMEPVDLRVRCRNGKGKCLKLHRHYDKYERMIYIVGEETLEEPAVARPSREERRAAARRA